MSESTNKPGRGRPRKEYHRTSLSLSPEGLRIWSVAAERLGLQRSPALEIILRDYAKRHDIQIEEGES